jgi:precorrin-6B methylase 2
MDEPYFIGVDGDELGRLRQQDGAWGPETKALWQRAGFARGMHIADLGCGPGFTSMDLAELVGTAGRVTALDKAATFLEFLAAEAKSRGIENVRTVATDLTTLTRIDGALDGAFSRWFLAFLVEHLDHVLDCIYRSLKPGGVLAVMEYLTLESASASPPMRGFDDHTKAWTRYYAAHGGDTTVGSYLPARLRGAGFRVTSIECVGGMAKPDHRWWQWWGRLADDFGEKLAAGGFMSAQALEHLRADWRSASAAPDAFIYTPILVQIVASKPEP